jgi:glycosyltransferase involved in cell wall biosynthesis
VKKEKNILVFCPYYPPHVGGLESHAQEFNYYLSKKGYKITVFTPNVPKINEDIKESRDVRVFRFPAIDIVPNYPLPAFWKKKFWLMFSLLFSKEYILVISRTRFFLTSFMALCYSKIRGIKWMHIEHGSDFVRLSNFLKTCIARLYDELVGRLIFRLSDVNVVISEAVGRFVKKFDKRESVLIYRGLDFEKIDKVKKDDSVRRKYKDNIIMCFCGRLFKWKGVFNSILAIKRLSENYKRKMVFFIIGDGEDMEELKKKANEKVIFWGEVERERAISLLKTSDIYVHSSMPGGGLSTSLLEAIYCNLFVVATPNEGAEEIVKESFGVLVESSDSNHLKGGIVGAINKLQKTKNAGKNYLLNLFSWSRSIEKYCDLIVRLTSE